MFNFKQFYIHFSAHEKLGEKGKNILHLKSFKPINQIACKKFLNIQLF